MQKKLCLRAYNELYVIDLEMVMYLQADDHYTHVYYSSGTHFMVPFGLSKVEQAITNITTTGERFLIRMGREFILNLRCIYQINTVKQIVMLSDNHGINLSLHLSKPVLRSLIETVNASLAPDL